MLTRLLKLQPGEAAPVAFLLALSFAKGIALIFFEAPANTLFLKHFSVEVLPWVYVGTAVVSVALGVIYAHAQKSTAPGPLLLGVLAFLAASVLLLYLGLQIAESPWLALTAMIWKDVLWVLLGIQFWATAGMMLDLRQGKRLFALVASGEIVAIIVGGFAVSALVERIGVNGLLVLCLLGLVASFVVFAFIVRRFSGQFVVVGDDDGSEGGGSIVQMMRNRYLRLFFVLSVLSYLGSYFIDFVFYERVAESFTDDAALAGFFGVFFAVLGILQLFSSSVVAGPMLMRFGVGFGILALPLVSATGMGAVALATLAGAGGLVLWLTVGTKLVDEVFGGTVETPIHRILYQPLPASSRLRVQAVRESILEPVAIGVSGVILLLLTSVLGLGAEHLVLLAIGVLALGFLVGNRLRREYVVVLAVALNHRILKLDLLSLTDAATIRALRDRLKSEYANEAIYAFELLESADHKDLPDAVIALASHPQPAAREHAYRHLPSINPAGSLELVRARLTEERNPRALGAVVRALCALGDSNDHSRVHALLTNVHAPVRKAAHIGLIRVGGSAATDAFASIEEAARSPDSTARAGAADTIGASRALELVPALKSLLADEQPSVRRLALGAAGRLKAAELIEPVACALGEPGLQVAATDALLAWGPAAVTTLAETLSSDSPVAVRIAAARVCARIGTPAAVDTLRAQMDVDASELRTVVLSALMHCSYQAPEDDAPAIIARIDANAEEAVLLLQVLCGMDAPHNGLTAAVVRALEFELVEARNRCLALLSFIYPTHLLASSHRVLNLASADRHPYALEILDSVVDGELKRAVLPLVEPLTADERLRRLGGKRSAAGWAARLAGIVTGRAREYSTWTRACALYALGDATIAATYSDDNEPLLREVARGLMGSKDADD